MKRNILKITLILAAGLLLICSASVKAACQYQQSLNAEEFPIGMMLSWTTTQENNNSMFILEKSDNGTDYQTIGSIRGAGTTREAKRYRFLDHQAANNKVFYRLKQVDFNGNFTYSETLNVTKKLETNILLVQLSSETVNKTFDFTVDALKEGGVVLQLIDGTNKIVWQGTHMLTFGLNSLSIDVSPYREGMYKVLVHMGRDIKTLTIQKLYADLAKN